MTRVAALDRGRLSDGVVVTVLLLGGTMGASALLGFLAGVLSRRSTE